MPNFNPYNKLLQVNLLIEIHGMFFQMSTRDKKLIPIFVELKEVLVPEKKSDELKPKQIIHLK